MTIHFSVPKGNAIEEMISLQKQDNWLWENLNHDPVLYLREQIQRLHKVIESDNLDEIQKEIEFYRDNCVYKGEK